MLSICVRPKPPLDTFAHLNNLNVVYDGVETMDAIALSIVSYAWIALATVWLVLFFFTKRTVRKQPSGRRALHLTLSLTGFFLLTGAPFHHGVLATRFIPYLPSIHVAGAVLTVAGCLFAIWARVTIGGNWSGNVTVKSEHELIVEGPYSLARHPIYTGILLALAGTALAIGEIRGLIGFALILFSLSIKIRQEERMMTQTFPESYPPYRQRVKALIPGIW